MANRSLVVSFYHYFPSPLPLVTLNSFINHLFQLPKLEVKGRTYVSPEGVNAQLSLPFSSFNSFREVLMNPQFPFFQNVMLNLDGVFSSESVPFEKFSVKQRPIIADDLTKHIDIFQNGATFLKPLDWHNELVDMESQVKQSIDELNDSQQKRLVIDCRNWYESEIGRFQGAKALDIDKHVQSFKAIDKLLQQEDADADKTKIMLYCTGGIRCVKLGAFVKQELGFKDVNQLHGGIVNYVNFIRTGGKQLSLEELATMIYQQDEANQPVIEGDIQKSKFIGKNFVFDGRMGQRVTKEVLSKCYQCGESCDVHINCENPTCNILFIQCESCKSKFHGTCSTDCKTIATMDEEERKEYAKKHGNILRTNDPKAFGKQISIVKSKVEKNPPLELSLGAGVISSLSRTFHPFHFSKRYFSNKVWKKGVALEGINEYCQEMSSELDPYTNKIWEDAFREQVNSQMMSSKEQGIFLSMLVSIAKPKRILEIGTFVGFSAISMANSLPDDGKLVTLEFDKKTAETASKAFSSSPVKDKIEIVVGPALEYLSKLGPDSFDLVFIDADKGNYQNYYDTLLEKKIIKKGGLIVIDNVLWSGLVLRSDLDPTKRDEKTGLVFQQFNDYVAKDQRTKKVMIPIRDGVTLAQVL